MAQNWNESARLARGEFLLILGQDDLLADDGVENLVSAARAQNVDLVFGGQGHIGPDGHPIANPSRSLRRESILPDTELRLSPTGVLTLGLSYGNILGDPCSTLIRKSAFDHTSGFSSDFRHAADLELWMRLAAAGSEALSLNKVVASHRSHNANATTSHVSSGLAHTDRVKMHLRYGSAICDDVVWNRSVARLHVHAIFDILRYRIRTTQSYPPMRGTVASRINGWFCELTELVKIKKPDVSKVILPEGAI